MRRFIISLTLLSLLAGALLPGLVGAQALEPPRLWTSDASLDALRVDFDVRDGAAVARYELDFSNETAEMAEGRIVLPVPRNSSVSELVLAGGPETLEGEMLGSEEAARIYQEIVRRLIDPALLQSIGDDLYEVRAFPVPFGEQRQVRFTVTTPLLAEADQVEFAIPWSRMSPRPASAFVSGLVDVSWDVRAALAPTYNLDVERMGDGELALGWEAPRNWAAETDFNLYLSGGEGLLDTQLLPYRVPGDDGFFALLLAPTIDPGERVPHDVILVLDTSGSMEGEKLAQAQDAARFVLERLHPDDRFGVITYSTQARIFEDRLHEAAERAGAIEFVDAAIAAGSTNISGALQLAFDLANGDRPATILFLTDGLPTAGLSEPAAIVDASRAVNPGRTQLFAFGVGYDVNTLLLDSLTQEFVGTSHYVTPGERIDTEVARLFEKVSSPVLTDVTITIDGGDVTALTPATLTGVFAGSQTLVTGRYGEAETIVVTVTGQTDRGRETFTYELRLPERATADPTIAQLWAQQRVADLLTEVRLEGARDSLIAEIVSIATQFGIVTPYTSFLARESTALFSPGLAEAEAADEAAQALSAAPSGVEAVADAEASEEFRSGEASLGSQVIRVVGAQSFGQVGEAWVAAGLDIEAETTTVTVGSEAFATLLSERPELAQAAALGPEVVVGGTDGNIRIVWPDPDDVSGPTLPASETAETTATTDPETTPETSDSTVEPGGEGTDQPPASIGDGGDGDSRTGLWIGISLGLTALAAVAGFAVERRMRRG